MGGTTYGRAQQLLRSSNPARLDYTWRDGSPRVVAMWFEWSDGQVVMGTPARAPKLKVLQERPASRWPGSR